MPPVRTWKDINTIFDSIDWIEFFKTIDENNQFQALGRSLKLFRVGISNKIISFSSWRNELHRFQFSHQWAIDMSVNV